MGSRFFCTVGVSEGGYRLIHTSVIFIRFDCMEVDTDGLAAPVPGRSVPGARTLNWIVSLQPRTARPAACRGCHHYFEEGEVRLCSRGDGTNRRWVHLDCMACGLRAGMTFTPDSSADAAQARLLTDRMASDATLQVQHATQILKTHFLQKL